MKAIAADALDLPGLIRPGDTVVVAQGTAEPVTLTAALLRQRHAIGRVRMFLGAVFSDGFTPEATDGIAFAGYGAVGAAAGLPRAGRLVPFPVQYNRLPGLFADGPLPEIGTAPD